MAEPESSSLEHPNGLKRRRTRKKPEDVKTQFSVVNPPREKGHPDGECLGKYKCKHCDNQEYIGKFVVQ